MPVNTSQQEAKLNPQTIHTHVLRPHIGSQTIFTSRGCFLMCDFHMGFKMSGLVPRPFHSCPQNKGEEAGPQGAGGIFSSPGNLHQVYAGRGAELVPELVAKQRMESITSPLPGFTGSYYLSAVSHMPSESLSRRQFFFHLITSHIFIAFNCLNRIGCFFKKSCFL